MPESTCAVCGRVVLVDHGLYATSGRAYHPDCYERMRARQDGEHIVVVDAHVVRRELIVAALRADGHAVREAGTPEEATGLLAARAKLLVVDLRLPWGGAVGLIRRVRGEPSTRNMPIIAVAPARAEPEHVQAALDAGASMCSVEPVTSTNFKRAVTIMLQTPPRGGHGPLRRD
jgi:CheY-like chemotaxis protein